MDKTMDTVPGGETPQYESIKTHTVEPAKQRGQLGTGPNTQQADEVNNTSAERGAKTAENIRYGQGISEGGFGGMTTTTTGSAQQGGYGGVEASDDAEQKGNSRTAQKYGPGSGVGA